MPLDEFQNMNWEAPIIRHEMAGNVHFISLSREYLDAMMLGIGTYQLMAGIKEE